MTAAREQELDARDRILRAAAELFYRDGILATGVDALIERANVAKATFYRHFPSKDLLVLAWLRGPDARWIDWVVPEVERRAGSPLERLIVFWDVLGDWLEAHGFVGCPFLNTLVEIRDPEAPARREIEAFVNEVEAHLGRTAAAAGLQDASELARRMRYLAMGVFMGVRVERSLAPIETARASAIGLLALWLDTTPRTVEERLAGTTA
jgi:AcrR family transcriptional regulator